MTNPVPVKRLLKVSLVLMLALLLGSLAFLSLRPQVSQAQGGSSGADGSLLVTETVYLDTDRYSVTQVITAGSVTIPFSSGLDIEAGDEILIMTMQGPTATVVGTYETAQVATATTSVLTLTNPLTNSYDGTLFKIMVQRVPHYISVMVQNGGKLTAHDWDGDTGGVVFFRAQTVTVESGGEINATGLGYRGGPSSPSSDGYQGESIRGLGRQGNYPSIDNVPNDGGGGANVTGGGGNYGGGAQPGDRWNGGDLYGGAGLEYGTENLSRLYLGSGGGSGYLSESGSDAGGNGGGLIYIEAGQLTIQGMLRADGTDALSFGNRYGAGGGSGGSIHLVANEINLGEDRVTALGGLRTCHTHCGGNGGTGRIRLDYNLLTGSTNPAHYQGPAPEGVDLILTLSGILETPPAATISYTLTLQNNSLITAPDVILTQTLPLSVAFDSASTSPTSSAGQTLVWQVGDLASLASLDLIVTGTVDASATVGLTLVATAVVRSDLAEAVASNNTRFFTTTVAAGPDLLVSKSKSAPAQAYAGQPVTYTLTVTNTGPLTATDVVLTDTLPADLYYVSEASEGLTLLSGSPPVWQADEALGPGQVLTVTLVVTPDEGLADGATVTNTITATTATPELNLVNNEAEVSHTVQQPKPQLALSPGLPTLSVAAGQTGTVTMTIGNSGQLALTGLVVTAPAVMPWVELTPASRR